MIIGRIVSLTIQLIRINIIYHLNEKALITGFYAIYRMLNIDKIISVKSKRIRIFIKEQSSTGPIGKGL